MAIETRLERLRQALSGEGVEWLLVTQPENRVYLSGYPDRDPGAGWLLLGPGAGYFLTDSRFVEAVRREVPALEAVLAANGLAAALADLLAAAPGSRVGFEVSALTVQQHRELGERLGGRHELAPTGGLVEGLRQVKEPAEIAAIAAAVELTDRAYEHALGLLRPGVTERQVAWEIEKHMREHGAEEVAFPLLVAAGPNSAVPHHHPTDRPIAEGEPVWVDIGARLGGYCGDLTRSFCLGRPDERFQAIYDLVLRAQLAAEAGLRPGLTGAEGDALARDVIAAAGHGADFGHSLGHGIGLAVHEAPRVSRLGTAPLLAGMVTSVEPGVYIPGWGGVRIEDLVVLEEGGARVLTGAAKQSIISQ